MMRPQNQTTDIQKKKIALQDALVFAKLKTLRPQYLYQTRSLTDDDNVFSFK